MTTYINYAQAHPAAGYADAIYPTSGGVAYATSQGFATGVPEPAAWTIMISGLGLVGLALRRRRSRVRAVWAEAATKA
jgi:hypothetical protein